MEVTVESKQQYEEGWLSSEAWAFSAYRVKAVRIKVIDLPDGVRG